MLSEEADVPDIVTLSGSPAVPSRSQYLLSLAERMLAQRGYSVQRIDIRDLPAAALLRGDWQDGAVRAARDAVGHARAVLVATPLYNAAYSGMLKVFLDVLPRTALSDKPVLPIATGGTLAHLLALDYALKPVLSALGARLVLENVFATEDDLPKIEDAYAVTSALEERLLGAVQSLIRTLDDTSILKRMRARIRPTPEYAVSP